MNDPKTTHDEITTTFGQIAARGVEDALLESFERVTSEETGVHLTIVEGYVQASIDGDVVAVLPLYLAKTRAFWLMSEIEA